MSEANQDRGRLEPKQRRSRANELLRDGARALSEGRAAEAVSAFEQLVAARPDDAHAWHRLGDALAWANDFARAKTALQRAVDLDETNVGAWGRLGNVLSRLRDPDSAVTAFARALSLKPDSVELLCNLGEAQVVAGRAEEAIEPLERAVKLAPSQPIAHLNLGCALMRLRRIEEAQGCFERAIALSPQLAQAHLNLAMALLIHQHDARGWAEFEWRLQRERAPRTRDAGCGKPRWNGEPLEGKTILLHAEQGYGDAFQFVRYAEPVARAGGRVLLNCRHELAEILRTAPGVERVIESSEPPPAFDFYSPLMSLPLALGAGGTIPSQVPYLHADQQMVTMWAEYLNSAGGLKVGLAWAGNPSNTRDRYRSMRFELIAPLLDLPGVSFINLQKTPAGEAPLTDELKQRLIDPTPELHDWSDTAALLTGLDLIVTVDTAVAHLAGALARPAWTMLSSGADWRWQLDRDDSPWYPTMRLFRQQRLGAWEDVVERVKEELALMATAAPTSLE